MQPKRLEERLGTDRLDDTSTDSVQAIFRDRSPLMRTIEPILGHVRARRPLQVALMAAATLALLALGYAIGGGFSASETSAATTSSEGVFITTEQADVLHQQSSDLQQAQSDLAIAEGELAFLRSRIEAISNDRETWQQSFNESRTELTIVVGMYEECLERLYPVECIENARPATEAFLAELYTEKP